MMKRLNSVALRSRTAASRQKSRPKIADDGPQRLGPPQDGQKQRCFSVNQNHGVAHSGRVKVVENCCGINEETQNAIWSVRSVYSREIS